MMGILVLKGVYILIGVCMVFIKNKKKNKGVCRVYYFLNYKLLNLYNFYFYHPKIFVKS